MGEGIAVEGIIDPTQVCQRCYLFCFLNPSIFRGYLGSMVRYLRREGTVCGPRFKSCVAYKYCAQIRTGRALFIGIL